jgi:CheY-like chemotaxis protein
VNDSRSNRGAGSDAFTFDDAKVQSGVTRVDARPCILVIDDSPTARAKMVGVLKAAGFATLALPTAIGATRLLMRSKVHVVVADITMPGLSGDRLVGVLRRSPRLKDLAIVIVSGTHRDELDRIAREGEVDATLSKRDIDQQLVLIIRRVLFSKGVSTRASGS